MENRTYQVIDVSSYSAGGSISIDLSKSYKVYVLTGVVTLSGNLSISASGSVNNGDSVTIINRAAINVATSNFTLFGKTVYKTAALLGFNAYSFYQGGVWTVNINVSDSTPLRISTYALQDSSVTTVKIADSTVTLAKIQDIPTGTILANISGATDAPSAVPISNVVGSLAWTRSGNAGTNAAVDFIGTTDAQDLVLKVNNAEKARLKSGGSFLVGTTSNVNSSNAMEVGGNLYTTNFQMPTGASSGKVLTSDLAGNASWQSPSGAVITIEYEFLADGVTSVIFAQLVGKSLISVSREMQPLRKTNTSSWLKQVDLNSSTGELTFPNGASADNYEKQVLFIIAQ